MSRGLWITLVVGVVACKGGKQPEPVTLPEPDAAIVKLLSAHDAVACSDIEADAAQLLAIVEGVERPSTVPMRAAGCLIERYPVESEAAFVDWVTAEGKAGLAKLVMARIDDLPEDVRARVEDAAGDSP